MNEIEGRVVPEVCDAVEAIDIRLRIRVIGAAEKRVWLFDERLAGMGARGVKCARAIAIDAGAWMAVLDGSVRVSGS